MFGTYKDVHNDSVTIKSGDCGTNGNINGTWDHNHGSNNSRNGTLSAAIGSTRSDMGRIGFKHTNSINVNQNGEATYTLIAAASEGGGNFNHWTEVYGTTADGNNIPPYLGVYMWKRTK